LQEKYEFDFGIANIVKCRPMQGKRNRPPVEKEIEVCGRYILKEIEQYRPKVIVALGNTAHLFLMQGERPLTRSILQERGCVRKRKVGHVMVTPHPAFLLRGLDPNLAGLLYSDIEKAVLFATKGIDFKIPNKVKSVVIDSVGAAKRMFKELRRCERLGQWFRECLSYIWKCWNWNSGTTHEVTYYGG
jgi:hypothetical protein